VVPEQEKIIQGLKREDIFTVVSEQFLTDTARYADIVLPATTQLEQFDLMFSWGHLYLSLNQQAIAPLGESVSNTELFRRLARTMGFDDRQWQRSDEEMAVDALDWANPALQGITMDLLKEKGWARLNVGTPETYAPHCQRQLPHPVRQVRIQGVNGGRRQLCATALPSRLERIPGGRAGRSAANLRST
jgi:anaerobic selenocysteine-containing dehydrogenase